jgi:hypothetical protein
MAAALALVRKGADMSRKNMLGRSALDLCTDAQVQQLVSLGHVNVADTYPLLPPPQAKSPNCCYVTLLVERSAMQSTDHLQRPFLTFTLYRVGASEKEKPCAMETPQTVVEPAVKRPDYLWWGSTLHIQAPLENMGTEEGSTAALLCVELRDAGAAGAKPGSEEGIAWATLDVSKSTITTRDVQLEMYSYPVDLRRRKMNAAGVFLSVGVMLSRADDGHDDDDGQYPEYRAPAAAASPAPAAAALATLPPAAPTNIGSRLTALTESFKAVSRRALAIGEGSGYSRTHHRIPLAFRPGRHLGS